MEYVIDYDLLDKQVQSLPVEVIEIIRRYTYRKLPIQLQSSIVSHPALKYVLDRMCEQKNIKKNNIISLLKFLNDKNQIIPFNYSTVAERMMRYYKYRDYKNCFLIDKIMNIKSFGILWNILTNQEQVHIIRYIHYNY